MKILIDNQSRNHMHKLLNELFHSLISLPPHFDRILELFLNMKTDFVKSGKLYLFKWWLFITRLHLYEVNLKLHCRNVQVCFKIETWVICLLNVIVNWLQRLTSLILKMVFHFNFCQFTSWTCIIFRQWYHK